MSSAWVHARRVARFLSISVMMLAVLAVAEALILGWLGVPIPRRTREPLGTVSRFRLRAGEGGAAIFRYVGNVSEQCWTEAVVFPPQKWGDFWALDCGGRVPIEIACSPINEQLAVACRDGTVLWYVDEAASPVVLGQCEAYIVWLAFSPNGRFVAIAGDGLQVWDLEADTSRKIAVDETGLGSAAFASDSSSIFVGGGEGQVTCWEIASGERRARLGRHQGTIEQIIVSPTGRHLVSTAADRSQAWEIATGKLLWSRPVPAFTTVPMDFSPDGRTLAAGSVDWWGNWSVTCFDPATGKPQAQFDLESQPAEIDVVADGNVYVRTASGDLHCLSAAGKALSWRLASNR